MPPASGPPASPSRQRVLVVDDDVDSADTLAGLFRIWGHEVRVTHDGPSALAEARAFRPEILLVDVGLPGMDGYELARSLRRQGLSGRLLACVSGWVSEADRRRAREAGFDLHLAKPVPLEVLRGLLARPGGTPGA